MYIPTQIVCEAKEQPTIAAYHINSQELDGFELNAGAPSTNKVTLAAIMTDDDTMSVLSC